MSTPCQGCKALVIQTTDDYNVYSLQRQMYPVDPLMILPQPNSWVDHVCEDGFLVHRLFTQMDDSVTFWQQILAECANHTVPIGPIVISNPNTIVDNTTPYVDPNTLPNNDPAPGPGDHVSPPLTPPPENHPDGGGTPSGPGGGGTGNTWPPGQKPTFPSGQAIPPDDFQHAWIGYEFDGCLSGQNGVEDISTVDHSGDGFFGDYLLRTVQAWYAQFPDPKMLITWEEPTWYFLKDQGPSSSRHNMMIDYTTGVVWYGTDTNGVNHEGPNNGNYWQLCIKATVYVRRDAVTINPP